MTSRVTRRSVCWLVVPIRCVLLALSLKCERQQQFARAAVPQPVFRSIDGFPLATFVTLVRSISYLLTYLVFQ